MSMKQLDYKSKIIEAENLDVALAGIPTPTPGTLLITDDKKIYYFKKDDEGVISVIDLNNEVIVNVDDKLSTTSTNPVQNKIIAQKIIDMSAELYKKVEFTRGLDASLDLYTSLDVPTYKIYHEEGQGKFKTSEFMGWLFIQDVNDGTLGYNKFEQIYITKDGIFKRRQGKSLPQDEQNVEWTDWIETSYLLKSDVASIVEMENTNPVSSEAVYNFVENKLSAVDEQFGIIDNAKANKTSIGDLENLSTQNKENLVSAINEINNKRVFDSGDWDEIDNYIPSDEITTYVMINQEGSSYPADNGYLLAYPYTINDDITLRRTTQLFIGSDGKILKRCKFYNGSWDSWSEAIDISDKANKDDVGELNDLTTQNKDNLVNAVNEINTNKVSKSDIIEYVDGQARTLVPSSKAIHDYVGDLLDGVSDELISVIGDVDELKADNLINAINEINDSEKTISVGVDTESNNVMAKVFNGELPIDYKRLDYIESTGSQYILTDIVPNKNLKIELDVAFTATDVASINGYSEAGNTRCGIGASSKGYFYFGYGGSEDITISSDTQRHILTLDFISKQCKVDDRIISFATDSLTLTDIVVFSLFGRNRNNGVDSLCKQKLYEAKFYSNIDGTVTLIKHYVPCIDDNDVVGVYELIDGKFYTNMNNSTTFIAGNIIKEDLTAKTLNLGKAEIIPNTRNVYEYDGEKIKIQHNCVRIRNVMNQPWFEFAVTSRQGATNYDKYLFQFTNTNEFCGVYNLEKRKLIQKLNTGDKHDNFHGNNVFFSDEKFDENDRFPILYSCNASGKCIVGYRITGNDGSMNFTRVQTINLPTPTSENKFFYPNASIDLDNQLLVFITAYKPDWTEGMTIDWKKATNSKLVIFKLPKLRNEAGTIVDMIDLDYDTKLKEVEVPYHPASQGALVNNSRLYQLYGAPLDGFDGYLEVYDINTGNTLSSIRLNKNTPIVDEPEAIFIYNNKLHIISQKFPEGHSSSKQYGYIYELEF